MAEFVRAYESADIDAVVALLTDDMFMSMPPLPLEYEGRDVVARFCAGLFGAGRRFDLVPARANGQPAFGAYRRAPRPGRSPLNGSARTPQPSVDGRIGISQSTPSWLDTRSKPLGRFETVGVLSIHNARVSLEGSNSFVARSAPEAVFDDFAEAGVLAGDFFPPKLQTHSGRWLGVIDSRGGPRYQDGQFRACLLRRCASAARLRGRGQGGRRCRAIEEAIGPGGGPGGDQTSRSREAPVTEPQLE